MFVSSRRRHTRYWRDWSSDVCSSDLVRPGLREGRLGGGRARLGRGDAAGRLRDDPADGGDAARAQPVDRDELDRKSVVSGKSVDVGGRRIINKKTYARLLTSQLDAAL